METKQQKTPVKAQLQHWGIALGMILFLGFGFYHMFIAHSNEIGFLGMDKVGRQVFVQTLDSYLHPNVDVESEFHDVPLPLRLLQEPLRTTIKFDIQDEHEFEATALGVEMFLNQPASAIVDEYKDKITMQEDWGITPTDLRKYMKEKDVQTIGDLLSGYGFERFEMYSRGNLIKAISLPRTKNVAHVGGD
jgi:hypothetical protein